MNRRSTLPLLVAGFIALSGLASAETPTANNIVDRAISAAELESSMAEHDMIRLAIHQEETTSDGTSHASDVTALIHGANLENTRVELGQGISLVLNNSDAWAMIGRSARHPRPDATDGCRNHPTDPVPAVAALFPAHGGRPTRRGHRRQLRRNPGLGDRRRLHAGVLLGARAWSRPGRSSSVARTTSCSAPSSCRTWSTSPASTRAFGIVISRRQDIGGISLAAQVLLDGIDFNGVENGHVRVTKMTAKTAGPLDLSLFIHPEEQERLDSGDVF